MEELAGALYDEQQALQARQRLMDEGRSVIDRTRTATEQYAAEIAKLNELLAAGAIDQQTYARAVEEANDRALRSSQAWTDGATRFLKDYVAESQDAASAAERAFGQAFSGAEDALTGFVTTGKLEIKGLADSVLADITRMAVRQTITAPIAGFLQGALTSGGFGLFHEGGVVGERPSGVRYADAGVFEHAPRYHGGGFAGSGLGADRHPVRGAVQGFFLNLPALSAEDGQTGAFWLGAAPAWSLDNTKWRGAVIYRSSDGVSFTDYAAITTAVAWAKATTVLPVHERWGVWDQDNVLDVLVQSPGLEFESRTELEVLDGANLLLVGQEILQFADAEQLGPSEWRLSKLLRGRRGTEWAMSTHQVGEAVLVLDPAALTRTSSLDEVGLARFYRAVSIGCDPSLPAAVAFTNEAASLKPYAPVHLQGSRNGGGDLTITWVRRTRYSGEWRDLVDVPLNEASEAYEVDVLDGAGQVVRTLASTSPSVVYAAADQTTDFGAPQGAIEVAVYQVSAAVGRGFAGRATL